VSDEQIKEYHQFLKKVDLLAVLSSREREKVAEALEEVHYNAGETIVKQGEKGELMYILKKGEVVTSVNGQEARVYKPGDYFGERALLKDEPRAATCVARGQVDVLQIDRSAFSALLGPLEEIMGKRVESYSQPSASTMDFAAEEKKLAAVSLASAGSAPRKEDLKVIGTLGKGSFGFVQLVKDPKTGKTYALKALSKTQIVQTGQQGHVMQEKRAMLTFDHPFLTKLYATYKDRDRLYFLLEPSLGGELFSILRARTMFDEDTARFYAAQVVLAFEMMHSKNYLYRTSSQRTSSWTARATSRSRTSASRSRSRAAHTRCAARRTTWRPRSSRAAATERALIGGRWAC